MKDRPKSVTVISWVLVVMGGISLITSTLSLNNPAVKELMSRSLLPTPLQYAMLYLGLFVMLVSGIAMLKGQNWARFLYVIWSAVGSVIGLVTSPMKAAMLPGIAFFVVIAFFLFRPKANEYFAGHLVTLRRTPTVPIKAISIVLYVIAGFFISIVSLASLIKMPQAFDKPDYVVMSTYSVIAIAFTIIAAAFNQFQRWRFAFGVTLLCGAGAAAFNVITLVSPEMHELFPENKFELFSDYGTGAILTLLFMAVGIALIVSGKQKAAEPGATADASKPRR